jgi:hypothetical protein
MVEEYMEISKEEIENVANALKVNADYKLNNTNFNINTFEKGQDIVIIQYVANVENELVFKTKEENGKYYISNSFELFIDNIIGGNVSRDVFQSVYQYFRRCRRSGRAALRCNGGKSRQRNAAHGCGLQRLRRRRYCRCGFLCGALHASADGYAQGRYRSGDVIRKDIFPRSTCKSAI